MRDRSVVALALCAIAGALRPSSLPLGATVAVVLAALVWRSALLLCLGVLLLVSSLAGRSLDGLDGVEEGVVADTVILLTDPAPASGGVRAEARLGGRHVELRADGPSAAALRPRLAGEQVTLRGRMEPVPSGARWAQARHLAARVRVHAVEGWHGGGLLTRGANGLRRTLERGAAPLSPQQRSLFTGLTIGDDRAQPVELADDFLGAGLTHLLAVSGQNVAFVLTLAAPVLRRLRLWPRLAATLAVVAMFGLMTRFEPSVLRAVAMVAVATTTSTLSGAPSSRLRILAFALVALLVVDPLLVDSVGFRLSAAASAAIVVAAPRLAAALPGPAPFREALAVTLAAQLGVAPLLLATFGPLPVASLPANLLAVAAAGPVMVWGLTGGLLAGVFGGWCAALIHLPTRALLTWVSGVARWAAALPVGTLRASHLAGLAIGLVLLVGAARWRPSPRTRVWRTAGAVLAVSSVAAAVVAAQAPPALRTDLVPGITRWHAAGAEVVVLGGVGGRAHLTAARALAALREAGVGAIDLLVVADPSVEVTTVRAIGRRHRLRRVVLATDVPPSWPEVVTIGALEVHVTATPDRLVVEGRARAPAG
ncbi:MAG: ComEC/Rec2 family competence protein [Microthrixaceae bacterium]